MSLARAIASTGRPRPHLTVSQWADAHRRLSSVSSAESGPWRTDRTPYLREPMDCLSVASPVQRLVLRFASQTGKTELGLNALGYLIHHAPCPILVVVPTLEVRRRWVAQRLNPLLTDTPALAELINAQSSRDTTNAQDIKQFPGGILVLGGANSPASLASMPIQVILCDEVDRFPWEVGREGDPLGLTEIRANNFPRRKIVLISSPTIHDASRIDAEYEASDQRTYWVPCPHCGEYQTLQWSSLQWTAQGGTVNEAWCACAHCGALIQDHHKPALLARGEWRAAHPGRPTRGYHLSALYSPLGLGLSWTEIAQRWLAAQDDPGKLKVFYNTIRAESWRDKSAETNPEDLESRSSARPQGDIPSGCLLLTAGVDTQDDRLEVQVLGWGKRGTCWVIGYHVLRGNPAQPEVWAALTALVSRPYRNAYGRDMAIQAVGLDTAGHHTADAYAWVRFGGGRRRLALKGANTPGREAIGRPKRLDFNWRGKPVPGGVELWMVGTEVLKSTLFARLEADQGQPEEQRRIHFPAGLGAGYYRGLTSEVFDPETNRWVPRRGVRRNEVLDTWVYAAAAAHHPELAVPLRKDRDWDQLRAVIEPASPTPPTPPDPAAPPDPPPPAPDPGAEVLRRLLKQRKANQQSRKTWRT